MDTPRPDWMCTSASPGVYAPYARYDSPTIPKHDGPTWREFVAKSEKAVLSVGDITKQNRRDAAMLISIVLALIGVVYWMAVYG